MMAEFERRPTNGADLRTVCDEAVSLIQRAPATVRRIAVRAGDVHAEIELSADDVGQQAPSGIVPLHSARCDGENEPEPPGHQVLAPLVGTFNVSPSPGAPPFVRVGDEVEVGTTLGVVEAMKLMNPISADTAGRVVEVCVPDATPVQFGQVLFRIAEPGKTPAM
jgi:acetyl-CoA carboxylase biotin carboxyl carrier protein